jgi:hypothetical protein
MLALSKQADAHEQRLIEANLHVRAESSVLALLYCNGCSMTAPAAVFGICLHAPAAVAPAVALAEGH